MIFKDGKDSGFLDQMNLSFPNRIPVIFRFSGIKCSWW